jgi:monoamine oxidase
LNTTDIVIVGGGAAGVGAARRLARSNYSTLLLEAGARLGGRAWTQDISDLHLDLGCGWFHSAERNAWIAIAEKTGVPIDRSPAQWGHQYRDLGFPKPEQTKARQAFEAWMHRLERSPPASDCAADALAPDCEWNDYIRTIVGFISGATLERLSVADYRAYDEASSENNWRAPSGLGALVARSLPSQVIPHLATPVDSIGLPARGVTLETPAGQVHARAAILTVSTAVLAGETLKLPVQLAPWRDAANQLPLGRDEKLFLEITGDAPFEAETQLLGNPRQRTASYYIRPFGSRVIECFFGGEGARLLDEGGHAAGFDFALGQICALFGSDVRRSLRPLTGSSWSQMKHIGGAYSYALPGHAAARQALARPFDDRLFFAGEATSAGDFSTAHGAYDSGVRAAHEAIAALGKAAPA